MGLAKRERDGGVESECTAHRPKRSSLDLADRPTYLNVGPWTLSLRPRHWYVLSVGGGVCVCV